MYFLPNVLEERAQEAWMNLMLTDEHKVEKHIENIFARFHHQRDVLTAIYHWIIPDFVSIASVDAPPEAGCALWGCIYRHFTAFDKVFHPEASSGYIWLVSGFRLSMSLEPWEISFDNCLIKKPAWESGNSAQT